MNISLRTFITRDFLIKYPDGTYDVNVYGDLCKLVGDALTTEPPIKRFKFESKEFYLNNFTMKMWDTFIENCKKYVDNNPDVIPTSVTII